jgi:MoaA/NifB/PqqE/SkfB family radical SAM enzyme
MRANYLRNLGSLALRREPARPLLFSFYITHRCAWSCPYCSGGRNPFRESRVRELSAADAGRLFEILRREAGSLDISGGEPLVRPDLEDILERARALGFHVTLNTKGAGLASRPDILRLCDVLILGVDALDPDKLAGLVGGPDQAEAVREALEFALAGRKTTGPRVVLGVVAMPDNLEEVEKVLALAEAERCGFQLSPQIVNMSVHPGLRDNERYRRLVDKVYAAKRRGVRVMGVPGYFRAIRDFRPFRCHPLLMPIIRPDGRLYYPCLEFGWADADILEAGSYPAALEAGRRARGKIPDCRDRCHLFCHMGLSLLQRHPIAALDELRIWQGRNGRAGA